MNLWVSRGKDGAEGIVREFGMDIYIYTRVSQVALVVKKLPSNVGDARDAGLIPRFGGEWIHVYVWPSPFAVHVKLSQHC